MEIVYLLFAFAAVFLVVRMLRKSNKWLLPVSDFPKEWRAVLFQKVAFYKALNTDDKKLFEYKVHEFILNYRITGIKTDVREADKVLVAVSAVIPIFKFSDWTYTNLSEVLLYPDSFNEKFDTEGEGRNILGMVGTGYMEGKMILSKQALYHGFENETDKKNTGIHEFVHLIDKMDGQIDGIPSLLLDKQYTLPWLDLMSKKIDEIYKEKSDINPYGGKNKIEFFSVAAEYFFETPKLLRRKHPELYQLLEQIFKQDLSKKKLKNSSKTIGRNAPCPCGSKEKFKKCCGKMHY